jgi:hypothetical protein
MEAFGEGARAPIYESSTLSLLRGIEICRVPQLPDVAAGIAGKIVGALGAHGRVLGYARAVEAMLSGAGRAE